VPPVIQAINPDNDLTLFYPKIPYYPADSEIRLSLAVTNSTNDFLTNTTTSCIMFIEFANGTALVNNETMHYETNYFDYHLYPANTSKRGEYNYFVYCSDDIEKGGLSGFFYINGNGSELTIPIMLLDGLLFIFLLGLIFTFSMGVIRFENLIAKYAFFNIAWFIGVIFTFFLWNFLDSYLINFTFIIPIIRMIFIILTTLTGFLFFIDMAFIILYIVSSKMFEDLAQEGITSDALARHDTNWFFRLLWRNKKK